MNKYRKFLKLLLVVGMVFVLAGGVASAESSSGGVGEGGSSSGPVGGNSNIINVDISRLNPLRDEVDSFPEFLEAILKIVVNISLPILVLAIIYTGFLFVTAQGNEQKLSAAKTAFIWTIAGAAIILGAFVIANVIEGTISNIRAEKTNLDETLV